MRKSAKKQGSDATVFTCRSFAAKMAAIDATRLAAEEMMPAEIRDKIEETIDETQDNNYSAREVWLAVAVKIIDDAEMLEHAKKEPRPGRSHRSGSTKASKKKKLRRRRRQKRRLPRIFFHEEELEAAATRPKKNLLRAAAKTKIKPNISSAPETEEFEADETEIDEEFETDP